MLGLHGHETSEEEQQSSGDEEDEHPHVESEVDPLAMEHDVIDFEGDAEQESEAPSASKTSGKGSSIGGAVLQAQRTHARQSGRKKAVTNDSL